MMMKNLRAPLIGALLACGLVGAAAADPYSVSYTGVIGPYAVPEASEGQTYEVTLVVDNGGTTAANQTWALSDLKCVYWKFNDARDLVVAHDLVANPIEGGASGSLTTNGGGVNQTMFADMSGYTTDYEITGGAQGGSVQWWITGTNGVFMKLLLPTQILIDDTSGGVPVIPSAWTNPTPFYGDCDGVILGSPLPPPPVPTVSEWTMIMLGLLLASGAMLLVQLRRQTA